MGVESQLRSSPAGTWIEGPGILYVYMITEVPPEQRAFLWKDNFMYVSTDLLIFYSIPVEWNSLKVESFCKWSLSTSRLGTGDTTARNTNRPSDFLELTWQKHMCNQRNRTIWQRRKAGRWDGDEMGCRVITGFPGCASDKESSRQCRRHERCRFHPWVGKKPWRRRWQPTPAFLPGKSHGQRSLAAYPPRDCKRVRQDLVIKQQKVITLQLSAKAFLRNQPSSLDLAYEK